MEEFDLTPRQREVVESNEGFVLVLGGAGCGKTTTALWTARAELLRADDPSARIAFLTFSRTAVDQISSRSTAALASLGERVEVATFHAMAYRLVRNFGRYVGLGPATAELQSPAQIRLQGPREGLLAYDDLLPLALRVVESERVRDLLAHRWPLLICDEFQDTSEDQWQLLQRLGERSRLLLLADPNQMIYTFLPGVGPARLRRAKELADRVVELEPASHRDPSGAVPALALSIMHRDFDSAAVRDAVASGRLRVRTSVDDDELVDVIREELQLAWKEGARDYGIFGHSNEGVATLGHELSEAGVDHVLVGLPDAQGEAIAVMAVMCQFAIGGADSSELRLALATFMTACSRGSRAPELAVALATRRSIPRGLEERLAKLERALVEAAPDPTDVGRIVEESWPALGILSGNRPWLRACPLFGPVLRRATRARQLDDEAVAAILREAREMRSTALLDSGRMRLPPIKLMNFHQTKGRETDAVLLVYRDGDVLSGWRDSEPYVEPSRVLYVSLTRARQRVSVILPSGPHPLVAPFERLSR